ncbi:DUF397 domain-containing protein [Nocardiopsis ganjiahuensis]|uniref:DUF397 domain-containing protein n=1 Tax=Nocardiopsis ganjiahuensis TaxID=239984 RepID=UPI000475FD3E|nr:DUF397 domain-containing protein [Nocardiopsis ganjiahuensis]
MRGLGKDLGQWRKSSYSSNDRECVETVLWECGDIGLRDSTRRSGTVLEFRSNQWTALLERVRAE